MKTSIISISPSRHQWCCLHAAIKDCFVIITLSWLHAGILHLLIGSYTLGCLRCIFNEPFGSWRRWIRLIPYPYIFPFYRHICPSPIAVLHGFRCWLLISMSIWHEPCNCMILRDPYLWISCNIHDRHENCPLGAFIRSPSNPVGERIEYVQFVFPGPNEFIPRIGTLVRICVSERQ